jgi:hypothetical protein
MCGGQCGVLRGESISVWGGVSISVWGGVLISVWGGVEYMQDRASACVLINVWAGVKCMKDSRKQPDTLGRWAGSGDCGRLAVVAVVVWPGIVQLSQLGVLRCLLVCMQQQHRLRCPVHLPIMARQQQQQQQQQHGSEMRKGGEGHAPHSSHETC